MLLAGTGTGVYRADELPFTAVDHVLTDRTVRDLHTGPSAAALAATDDGLFRSTDRGDTWEQVATPEPDIHAVHATEDRLFIGVEPAAVLVSEDTAETWDRLDAVEGIADISGWPTDSSEHACVRSLSTPPGASKPLLVGVEVGGLLVSEDGGECWAEDPAIPDDVHHVLPLSSDRWIVSCGTGGPKGDGGVFETTNGGKRWRFWDTGDHRYVRESIVTDRLYTAGAKTPPFWNPPEAALFVESTADDLESVSYPGEPNSVVLSWTATDGAVIAGTNDGRILRGGGETWTQVGTVPIGDRERQAFGVRSLTTV